MSTGPSDFVTLTSPTYAWTAEEEAVIKRRKKKPRMKG
jgi:hypothetical protein